MTNSEHSIREIKCTVCALKLGTPAAFYDMNMYAEDDDVYSALNSSLSITQHFLATTDHTAVQCSHFVIRSVVFNDSIELHACLLALSQHTFDPIAHLSGNHSFTIPTFGSHRCTRLPYPRFVLNLLN